MAFAADRPVLIDAVTDPNIPPLPPHITFKQAKAMVSSMLKGDPSAHIIAVGASPASDSRAATPRTKSSERMCSA